MLRGHIDSALRRGWEENDARVAATLFGDVGEENPPIDGDPCDSSNLRRFSRSFSLISSACRLGGPRRRLGLWKVQGMSRAAQALHGGPVSSHWRKENQHLQLR